MAVLVACGSAQAKHDAGAHRNVLAGAAAAQEANEDFALGLAQDKGDGLGAGRHGCLPQKPASSCAQRHQSVTSLPTQTTSYLD